MGRTGKLGKRVTLLVTLCWGGWSFVTSAGGTDWSFSVSDIHSKSKSRYIIKLTPITRGDSFPLHCKELVVDGKFKAGWWRKRRPGFLTKSVHNDALEYLRTAQVSQEPIRFGIMGSGFGRAHGRTECEVKSKALYLMDDGVVYSYFKWP